MQQKIKKILNGIYIFFIILFIVTIAFLKPIKSPNSKDFENLEQISELSVYTIGENNEYSFSAITSAPANIYIQEPIFVDVDLSKVDDLENKSFAIDSSYMDFICYMDNNIIYEQTSSKNNIIYSSGSISYYIINFPKDIKDKKLTIKFIPTTKYNEKFTLNKITIGYRSNFIVAQLLEKDFVNIIVSFILLVLAIVLFFISIIFVYFGTQAKRIINISILSLCFSIFSLVSYKSTNYIFSQYRILFYFLKFLSLLYIPISVLKLMDNVIDDRFKKFSFSFIFTASVSYIIQILLTYFKIVEFKDSLLFSSILSFILMIIQVVFVILSKKSEEKKQLIISILPILSIFIISFITYISLGQFEIHFLLLLSALVFIGVQIYYGIKAYKNIMNNNEQTKMYKSLISYDTLTLLGSRRSFEELIKKIKDNPIDTTIIVADLNNLKWINDKMGHAYGDIFIKEASIFLRDNMKDSKIYRIGGDEFVIIFDYILSDDDFENIKNKKLTIKNLSDKIDTSISFGKCTYLKGGSIDIDEVFRIADYNMYQDKKLYKEKNYYTNKALFE